MTDTLRDQVAAALDFWQHVAGEKAGLLPTPEWLIANVPALSEPGGLGETLVTYAEEADSEQDAELADATLDAALAQRAPERSEALDVERLREAVYNTAVGPDDCKTWGRIADIAAEYARLATAEQGAACICTPTVDGGHRAFCPARLQGEQE